MTRVPGYATIGSMALALAGCAGVAAQQDNLLLQSGFAMANPKAPEWAAALKTLPPHRFARRTANGTAMYLFADPIVCKCVYYGTLANYANYKQLRADQDIAAFDEPPPNQ